MVAPPLHGPTPPRPRPRRAPLGSPDPLAAHVIRLGAAILEPRPRKGQKGGKRGKRVGSEADEGEGTVGVPAGQRRLAGAAARRPTAGTAPRAAPPLERRRPCAASLVTPAALPRTRARAPGPCVYCRPSAGPVETRGPPCRWGWGSRCSPGPAESGLPSGDVKALRPARMKLKFL